MTLQTGKATRRSGRRTRKAVNATALTKTQEPSPGTTLQQLLAAPDLARRIPELPSRSFAALVRQVGVEDAGELVALATDEQLVTALDEDLFVSDLPGEQELLDGYRFGTWLEVLLEAGDEATAARLAALSVDYLAHAMSSLVVCLDAAWLYAARSQRADQVITEAELSDALSQELRGYHLLPKLDDAWDAAFSALLALDRDHGEFLERVLQRCAEATNSYMEDEDALQTALEFDDSLREDACAEREDRRARLGYVEPRDAVAFLALARAPFGPEMAVPERDIISRAHLGPLLSSAGGDGGARAAAPTSVVHVAMSADPVSTGMQLDAAAGLPVDEALSQLAQADPLLFATRLEELAYLANVILAGATTTTRKPTPEEAAEAAFATVALGAELCALARRARWDGTSRASAGELKHELSVLGADLLFRSASAALSVSGEAAALAPEGFLQHRDQLAPALARLYRAATGPTVEA